MSKMITDDRFTADGRETLAGSGKMWSTEIQTIAGPVVRVRRVGTHASKGRFNNWYDFHATHLAREAFVDYRVSVDGRLVNSFLSKPLALAFAKAEAAKIDAVSA